GTERAFLTPPCRGPLRRSMVGTRRVPKRHALLVFLVPADSLFRTLNFQYGQFLIAGNVVRGWRDKANKPVDKLYADAQKEIECILNPNQTPGQPPPAGENNPPRTPVAGDPGGSRPGSPQALPAQ